MGEEKVPAGQCFGRRVLVDREGGEKRQQEGVKADLVVVLPSIGVL